MAAPPDPVVVDDVSTLVTPLIFTVVLAAVCVVFFLACRRRHPWFYTVR